MNSLLHSFKPYRTPSRKSNLLHDFAAAERDSSLEEFVYSMKPI